MRRISHTNGLEVLQGMCIAFFAQNIEDLTLRMLNVTQNLAKKKDPALKPSHQRK